MPPSSDMTGSYNTSRLVYLRAARKSILLKHKVEKEDKLAVCPHLAPSGLRPFGAFLSRD
jgi:hypothetical protein